MSRSFWLCLAAAIACGVSLSGCEDNPDQFYKQAPAGAGDRWNDGQTNPYADPHARNGFTENFNSTTKQEICSGPVKQKRWAEMVKAPIKPPRFIGGLDLAGGDAWTGLDFRDAEKVNCQSKSTGGDESTLAAQWGDAGEIEVTYKLSNNTIDFIQLNQGYRGTLDFESRPDAPGAPNPFGKHTYSIGVGVPVRRDGQPWEIKWSSPTWNKQATELYDALMYTFSPTLPGDQVDCIKAATCLARQVGGDPREVAATARPAVDEHHRGALTHEVVRDADTGKGANARGYPRGGHARTLTAAQMEPRGWHMGQHAPTAGGLHSPTRRR